MYEDVIAFLARVEAREGIPGARLRKTADAVDAMRRRHTGIPEDFLAYLQEIGSGALRGRMFGVFGDFIEPSYLLGFDTLGFDGSVVCFGGDSDGNASGFRLPGWRIVDIDRETVACTDYEGSFAAYIRSRIRMGGEGGDDVP